MEANRKIYIAGQYSRKTEMKRHIEDFKTAGYAITHDWTLNENNKTNFGENLAYLEENAKLDIEGVRNAKALVCILDNPTYEYRGTWTEIGCALGLNKPVFVYMPKPTENNSASNVFLYHKNVSVFESMADLKEELNYYFCLLTAASGIDRLATL